MFPTESVNRAVLLLGLSTDPFPDLGKLVAACQHIEADKNPQVVRGETSDGRPGKGLVTAAAQALGLEVVTAFRPSKYRDSSTTQGCSHLKGTDAVSAHGTKTHCPTKHCVWDGCVEDFLPPPPDVHKWPWRVNAPRSRRSAPAGKAQRSPRPLLINMQIILTLVLDRSYSML